MERNETRRDETRQDEGEEEDRDNIYIYTYIYTYIYLYIYLQNILRAGLFYLFYSNLSLNGLRERERVKLF